MKIKLYALPLFVLCACPAFAQQADSGALEKRVADLERTIAQIRTAHPGIDCDTSTFCDIYDREPGQFPDYITKGLEYHGYFRSGGAANSKGGRMESFMAPTLQNKYRLGNESDTYIESTFLQKNWNPDPNGIVMKSQLRLAYGMQENASFDTTNTVTVREAYAQ